MTVLQALRRRGDLLPDTDREGTVRRIRDGVPLSPESVWLLVASCLLASIGLDTDSVAVIIGAMLISPLMSPILAVGMGMATHDRALLLLSLRDLALATLGSLLLSALYFALSPLGEPTPQLAARTMPTLLDVGVAFFGGVAGIVAGSRRNPGLALPGVAIATALMPPLCTAGFGIATGNPGYFFGAFYLFFINAVFIALATFVVARLLGFPSTGADLSTERRARRLVGVLSTVALLPSLVILLYVVSQGRLQRDANQFVDREIRSDRVTVLDWSLQWPDRAPLDILLWRIAADDRRPTLKVYYAGDQLPGLLEDSLRARMASHPLGRVDLSLTQVGVSGRQATELRRAAEQNAAAAIAALRAEQEMLRIRLDSMLAASAGAPEAP
jgi:uncharacterized hydrophobic protein (TIGR00271 family)